MIRSKSFIQLVIFVVALTVFFQKGYAKKKVVESGEGYKIIEKTKKVKKSVSPLNDRIREVRCSHCHTRIYDLWARVCPSCGYKLGEMYVNAEETQTSVIITTNDASILKKIICSNPNGYARWAALSKVINENLLKECVIETQFEGDREKMLEKINNLEILKDLKSLINDTLENYKVQRRIGEIEFEFVKVRLAAVEKTTDPVALEKYALNDDDFRVREEAAQKINDLDTLLRILENERRRDKGEDIVIRKIDEKIASMVKELSVNDPVKLKDIALTSPSETIASKAVLKLTDRAFLREIALNARLVNTRIIAVRSIDNLVVLLEILKHESDTDVIRADLGMLDKHLTNKKIAAEIVSILSEIPNLKNDHDDISEIRIAFKIAKLCGNYGFFLKAIPSKGYGSSQALEFIPEIPDEAVILEIASNQKFASDYRAPAISRLRKIQEIEKILDQPNLPDDVGRSGRERLGELRLGATENNDALYAIYKNEKDFWIQLAAIRRMTNRVYLMEIANGADEPLIKNAVQIRLEQLSMKR